MAIRVTARAEYVTSTHDDKTYVSCNFVLDPRSYLSEEDLKELEKNSKTQISTKTKEKLLTLCETPAAKYSPVWNFEAVWRVECPVTNKKYLDPLFEEIKKRYPNKKLMINSNVSTHDTDSTWSTDKKYCEKYGIKNARILIQNLVKDLAKELSSEVNTSENYIVIGDEAFRDKVKSMLKGECEWHYYPTQ